MKKWYLYGLITVIFLPAFIYFAFGQKNNSAEDANYQSSPISLSDMRFGPFACGGEFNLQLAKKYFGKIKHSKIVVIKKDSATGILYTDRYDKEDKNSYLYGYDIWFENAAFKIADNKIIHINTSSKQFKLGKPGKEIQVGDSLDKVYSAYGKPLDSDCENDSPVIDYINGKEGVCMHISRDGENRVAGFSLLVMNNEQFDKKVYEKKMNIRELEI